MKLGSAGYIGKEDDTLFLSLLTNRLKKREEISYVFVLFFYQQGSLGSSLTPLVLATLPPLLVYMQSAYAFRAYPATSSGDLGAAGCHVLVDGSEVGLVHVRTFNCSV